MRIQRNKRLQSLKAKKGTIRAIHTRLMDKLDTLAHAKTGFI